MKTENMYNTIKNLDSAYRSIIQGDKKVEEFTIEELLSIHVFIYPEKKGDFKIEGVAPEITKAQMMKEAHLVTEQIENRLEQLGVSAPSYTSLEKWRRIIIKSKLNHLIGPSILLYGLIYQIYTGDFILGVFLYPMCIGGLAGSLLIAIRDFKKKKQ